MALVRQSSASNSVEFAAKRPVHTLGDVDGFNEDADPPSGVVDVGAGSGADLLLFCPGRRPDRTAYTSCPALTTRLRLIRVQSGKGKRALRRKAGERVKR